MTAEFLKSRTAALAALAAAVLLFALFVVTPIVAAFSAQGEETDDALHQLWLSPRRDRRQAGARSSTSRSEPERRLGSRRRGGREHHAGAGAAAKPDQDDRGVPTRGSVRSMQILPVTQQGGFEIIAVQCDLEIPQNRLKDLAYAVGSHAPYLFVDEASITAPASDPEFSAYLRRDARRALDDPRLSLGRPK